MEKIRTLYFGSGRFAIEPLEALMNLDFIQLEAVVTQPDKPFGRHKELKGSPLTEYLKEKEIDIQIEKPSSLRTEGDYLLEKYQPELIIVASYGKIIPGNILDYPKYKCLNLHGSLLPKLRGAVPVQMAILQGFETTGVTLQRMVTKLDEGPIIATREYKLKGDENSEELMESLATLGADIIKSYLGKWVKGEAEETPQNDTDATYCSTEDLSRDKAEIKVYTPIKQAERMIRAFYPDPVAWVVYQDKTVKIFKAESSSVASLTEEDIEDSALFENEIKFIRDGKKLYLELQTGKIEVLELQVEGKKRGPAIDHLHLAI